MDILKNDIRIEYIGEALKSGSAKLVVVLVDNENFDKLVEECKSSGIGGNVVLAGVPVLDWNNDMSPWPAPALFKKADDFGGGADAFLAKLTEVYLPEIRKYAVDKSINIEETILAGYSLAGLFALYSGYKTTEFDALVSCSGSMWYTDIVSFAEDKELQESVKKVYFSLGDKEKNSKNQQMKLVEENTIRIKDHLKNSGIETTFVLNEGGHFVNPEKRLASGIAWAVCMNGV